MKAIVSRTYGPPEVVRIEDIALPALKEHDISDPQLCDRRIGR